jgi:hypothetical protein
MPLLTGAAPARRHHLATISPSRRFVHSGGALAGTWYGRLRALAGACYGVPTARPGVEKCGAGRFCSLAVAFQVNRSPGTRGPGGNAAGAPARGRLMDFRPRCRPSRLTEFAYLRGAFRPVRIRPVRLAVTRRRRCGSVQSHIWRVPASLAD